MVGCADSCSSLPKHTCTNEAASALLSFGTDRFPVSQRTWPLLQYRKFHARGPDKWVVAAHEQKSRLSPNENGRRVADLDFLRAHSQVYTPSISKSRYLR